MRAPSFWWLDQPNAAARLLQPLGALYGAVTTHRMGRTGARAAVPVICVGNFVAGGAGKTPVALALARKLLAMGERPVFLSRGYGAPAGKSAVPVQVDGAHSLAADVGDEPLLLARVAPTIVSACRVKGAAAAVAAGASCIIMDDGLQNRALHQDLALAVVDGRTGAGNGLCIPAGPLRAPLAAQLPAVSALVLIGEGAAGRRVVTLAQSTGKPVLAGSLKPLARVAAALAGQRVLAFAGIGLPEKFFATLEAMGAALVARHGFGDHRPYARDEIIALQKEAERLGAMLVTTEKDMVRIAPYLSLLPPGLPAPMGLPVKLVFDAPDTVDALLRAALEKARLGPSA